MLHKKKIEILIYIALIIALLVPRLPALDSFSTLDEPYWLSMGANFYYALGQREFQNTVYEYQPAVTTMWVVTLAMLIYFPEYRGLGQGYLEFEKGALDPFLLEHGKDPLVLLRDARLIQVLLIAVLFLLIYFLLQRLISKPAAFFVVLFASFDPFFLGQSRLLDHEAMLSLFVVISVLAFFIYLSQGRRLNFLFLSAITAALAQLTKSSAIAILIPIGILLLIQIFQQRQNGLIQTIWDHTKIFVLWLLVLAGAYFIFWPGMWVAPGKMLYQVYGNAFSYAFQGARLAVTEDLQPTQFSLATGFSGIWDLSTVLLWRTSPLTWLGILLGCISPFILNRKLIRPNWQLPALLLFTAAAFILIFGIAQGRNSPHYILASYLALNLFAALGWFHLIERFVERFYKDQIKTLKVFFDNQVFTKVKQTFRGCLINLFFDHKVTKSQRLKGKKLSGLVPLWLSGEVIKQPLRVYLSGREVQYASLSILVLAQIWSAVSYFPYYYTYRNPLLYAAGMYSQAPQFAYGEGLELAAHYLAELPDAKNSTVIAFYARGCFSYFYPGETTRFKPYYVDAGHETDLVNSVRSADYLVLYYASQGHLDKYEPLLATLSSVQPIHEIWLDDYQYVTIYQVDSFPPAVFEAFAK